jgi:putative FmdB family regulatory protein
MPLFEYICLKCNHKFEELVLRSDEAVKCPECGTDLVTKQISTFASSSLAKGSDCNPASCGKSSFG